MKTKFLWLTVTTLLILGLVSNVAAQDLSADRLPDGVAIEAFGADGERLPDVARAVLPADYFSRDLVEAITDRRNYVTSWRVLQNLESHSIELGAGATSTAAQIPIEELSLRLVLTNDGEHANDIAVSARNLAEHRSRNFIVRVAVGEKLVVDADSVADADILFLTSLQAFTARVHADADGQVLSRGLEVAEPVETPGEIQNKSSIYCATIQRSIRICAVGGGCSIGYADRYDTGRTWSTNGAPVYYTDIDYPSAGSPFHVGFGASQGSGSPACKQAVYYTHRTDGSKAHYWSGLDDTLFSCGSSSAYCYQGCDDPGVPSSFTVTCN